MGEVGETVKRGRGGSWSDGNVLQGGGTGSNNFWIGCLGNFGRDGEEGGGHTNGFSEEYHGEAVTAEGRQEMGDAKGRSGAGSGGNTFRDELHMDTKGECGTVGGAAANF